MGFLPHAFRIMWLITDYHNHDKKRSHFDLLDEHVNFKNYMYKEIVYMVLCVTIFRFKRCPRVIEGRV